MKQFYFLKMKFQASSHILWLYSLSGFVLDLFVNSEDRFSRDNAHLNVFAGYFRSSNSPGGSPLLRYIRSKDTKEQMIIVSLENQRTNGPVNAHLTFFQL